MMLRSWLRTLCVFAFAFVAPFGTRAAGVVNLDLRNAVILTAKEPRVKTELVAAEMLQSEVQRRTGLTWQISSEHSGGTPVVAVVSVGADELRGMAVPHHDGGEVPERRKEGYRICVTRDSQDRPIVWVMGADARGLLFGIGHLLRLFDWRSGRVSLAEGTDVSTSPAYPIRGHQLGYRARANS